MTVAAGVLPVRFTNESDFVKEAARVALLVETLGSHWTGSIPFTLSIVCDDHSESIVKNRIIATDNIRIEYTPEALCLRGKERYLSRFDWWRRQQVINLLAVAASHASAVILLSPDVVCVKDFNESTFVSGGRLVSQWEPKSIQPWWTATESLLDVTGGQCPYGLSVVPNVISTSLARDVCDYVESEIGELLTVLSLSRRLVSNVNVQWTDMSLYTTVAEIKDTIWGTHLEPEGTFQSGHRVRSVHSVWLASEFEERSLLFDTDDPDAIFVFVSAAMEVSLDRIRRRFLSVKS